MGRLWAEIADSFDEIDKEQRRIRGKETRELWYII